MRPCSERLDDVHPGAAGHEYQNQEVGLGTEDALNGIRRIGLVSYRTAAISVPSKGIEDVADLQLRSPFWGVSVLLAFSRRFSPAQHRPHRPRDIEYLRRPFTTDDRSTTRKKQCLAQ
jgi:hypothetical protein